MGFPGAEIRARCKFGLRSTVAEERECQAEQPNSLSPKRSPNCGTRSVGHAEFEGIVEDSVLKVDDPALFLSLIEETGVCMILLW